MLDDATIVALAAELHDAQTRRVQMRHFSRRHPGMTIDDGYAIQRAWLMTRLAEGRVVKGRKIGLTSRAMQQASQIDEPDFGYLHDDMIVPDGAKLSHASFCRPRVEVELAFVLGKRLMGPGVGLTDVLAATEYGVPALEIVDARVQDQRKIFDTVADNGAAAGIVMGGRPVGPMDVDLRWVGGIMYKNSEIEETGLAAGVLGHPAMGVAWLANKLGSMGTPLEPGHVVLAGSFTRVVFAGKGDTVHGDFGPLGGIAVQFV